MKASIQARSLWLLLALSAFALTSCETAPKAGDTKKAEAGASQASEPQAETQGQSDEKKPSDEEKPKETKFTTDTAAKNPEAHYKTLSQAVRSGQGQTINDEAAKILSINPNDPIALNTLALGHLRRGKTGAAKLLLARALEKNQSAALYNNLAVAYIEEGDQVSALAQLKKALRVDDQHADTLANLGSLYASGGDYAKARPLLERAYRLRPQSVGIGNNFAITLRAGRDYDNAKKVYDDLMRANSRDVNVLLNYAILLIDYMNKPKEGLDLVNKLKFLESDRKDVLARANALEKKARSEVK